MAYIPLVKTLWPVTLLLRSVPLAPQEELMSDVFDLLLSLGDFGTFKEVMLAYKREASQVSMTAAEDCRYVTDCN